jgi:hypothetical protein
MTIYTTNTVYINWAVINNGTTASSTQFYVYLYTNSVLVDNWTIGSLPRNSYEFVSGVNSYDAGQFPAGTNTVSIVVDPTEVYDNPPATYTNTFVVLAPILPSLSAPVLTSPANGNASQSTSPVFTWSAVSNAASYEIIVTTNAADLPANTNATTGGASVIINANTTSTTYTPVNPLDPGTKYYWEVNARFASEGGPWSSTWNYTTTNPPSGLTIIPVFDSTITSDPQAITIESTIKAALAVYQNNFSDPITVSITFKEMNSGLGESSWSYYTFSYSAFRTALASAATTLDDSAALAHFPVQTGNPVNNNQNMYVKTAQALDLGLVSGTSGENVGTVLLYTGLMNLSDAQTDPSKYSLYSTVWHEVDEVLASGSALDEVNQGGNTATGPVFSEDLFRYDSAGNRNYTTSGSATSYFSINGTTDLAQFNQVGSGDYGDWYSYNGGQVPEVQDAFATAGTSPNLGVELRVLDVLGYHLETQQLVPQFVSETQSGNTITLVWTTVYNDNYQLLYSTNLSSSVWTPLGSGFTASDSTASYTDTISSSQQRFYRVERLTGVSPNVIFSRSLVATPPTGWGTNYYNPYQP